MLIFILIFVACHDVCPKLFRLSSRNYIPQSNGHPATLFRNGTFYLSTILRAIPDKLMGVIAMVSSIAILGLLPWLDFSKVRSSVFRPIWKQCVFLFVLDFFLLMYVGAMPAEGIYLVLGRIGTIYWFAFFIILAPLVSMYEKPLPMPQSINEYMDWKKKGKIKTFNFTG